MPFAVCLNQSKTKSKTDKDADRNDFNRTVNRLFKKSKGTDLSQFNYKLSSVPILAFDKKSSQLLLHEMYVNYSNLVMVHSFHQTGDTITALLSIDDKSCRKMIGNQEKYIFFAEDITREDALLYMRSINT